MRKTLVNICLLTAFLAALWSVPAYAEPDSVELDLSKGDIVITNGDYRQGEGEPVSHRGSYVIKSSGTKPVSHTITIESDLADITLTDVKIASK